MPCSAPDIQHTETVSRSEKEQQGAFDAGVVMLRIAAVEGLGDQVVVHNLGHPMSPLQA
jgi:hypothetical protein